MLKSIILYIILYISVMILGLMMFPLFHENAEIPLVPLVGFGSWIFGRKAGFILIIPLILYSYFLSRIVYAEVSIYYQATGCGVLIMIIMATLIGNLRTNYEDIQDANRRLDQRVRERTKELGSLTVKLINDTEASRIRHGQTLHDGIGQQLTGIQLYCTSLAEQLVLEGNPSASMAFALRLKCENAHNVIRKTARMLFPVRIGETGLIPAVNELSSCFEEIKHVSFEVVIAGDLQDIPEKQALALYRICHESSMCAVTGLNATRIRLKVCAVEGDYAVTLQHDGTSWLHLEDNMEQRLIMYRLKSLGGILSIALPYGGLETITYLIPKVV